MSKNTKFKLKVYINRHKKHTTQPIMPTNHKVEFKGEFYHCLEERYRQLAPDTKATILSNILYGQDFMDDIVFKHIMMKSRDHYHEHIFPNYKVLMATDECDGTLNYKAVDILFTLERDYWVSAGLFNKKRFKSILPSTSNLHRAANHIEEFADEIVPVTIFSTPSGKGFTFSDLHAVVHLLIGAYDILEVATYRLIEICSSSDAAPITKSIGALMNGI
jgi:hypothetical protein